MSDKLIKEYHNFVLGTTSPASADFETFIKRLHELHEQGCPIERLLTSSIGMVNEAGEFGEVTKKLLFHGKPWTDENRIHLKKELGDVLWYWINGCEALGVDPVEVITENMEKLKARYPDGKFSVHHSQNRKAGDV